MRDFRGSMRFSSILKTHAISFKEITEDSRSFLSDLNHALNIRVNPRKAIKGIKVAKRFE